MKKAPSPYDSASLTGARFRHFDTSKLLRVGMTATLGATLALCVPHLPQAQQRSHFREASVTVTGIASSARGEDTVVSISADGPLDRAQTYQTSEGFHVIVVNGQTALSGGGPRGVKVRRVGNSLEVVVPLKAGAGVTVQPRGNRLDLVVSGGAASVQSAQAPQRNPEPEPREPKRQEAAGEQAAQGARRRRESSVTQAGDLLPPTKNVPQVPSKTAAAGGAPSQPPPSVAPPVAAGMGDVPPPALDPNAVAQATEDAENSFSLPAEAQVEGGEAAEAGASFFSFQALWLLLAGSLVGGLAFIVRRRRRVRPDSEEVQGMTAPLASSAVSSANVETAEQSQPFEQCKGDRRRFNLPVLFERRRSGAGAQDAASREQKSFVSGGDPSEKKSSAKFSSPAAPAIAYGPYKVDQEVGKLIAGEPHSTEVLSSRAQDDRRAVETSLTKAIASPETDEDGRRRARMALEDYGFVARQSASLLLAYDAYERVSAARSLGESKSPQALPFLTEALYDQDGVVRTEAVQSLGMLGMPSAIGALLDLARRHPDIPATVIGPALTACSVESVELTGAARDARSCGSNEAGGEFTGEIAGFEPLEEVEQLPHWIEDEDLRLALDLANDADPESRIAAAQTLASFRAGCAVQGLAALAVGDESPAVRAAAVTGLGLLEHESVFTYVLVAMADDSREVRAAAARALSRLSFDRADAYVRVMEESDEQTLRDVASACVKAGLAAQAVSRLASEDRRQAYEAFSLLSLTVKAGETGPILDAVENHRDVNVRLTAVRLLGMMYKPELLQQLHLVAGQGGIPEEVRAAIMEAIHRAQSAHVENGRAEVVLGAD